MSFTNTQTAMKSPRFSFQGKMAPSSGELWGHHLMPQVPDRKRFYLKCKTKHRIETTLRVYVSSKTKLKPMLSDGPRRLLASEWSDSSPQMSKVSEISQVKNRK